MQSTAIRSYVTSTPEEIRTYINAALADPNHTNPLPIAAQGDVQLVLDEIWKILDSPALPRNSRDILRRLILKLATTYDTFPTALVLKKIACSDGIRHGEGAFGEVYCGAYNNTKVALKVPRMYVMMKPAQKELLRKSVFRESLIWKHLVHDHILPFFGVAEDIFPGRVSIVVPWMKNGSLPDYIHSQRDAGKLDDSNFKTVIRKRKWLHQISLGLAYLHGEGIVHGDLHPGNLLVDERGSIRISDFGLSLLADGTAYNYGSHHGGGAVYYTAPELFDPDSFDVETSRPTFRSDMYAFGCVCFELYSGTHPFPDLLPHQVVLRVVRGDIPSRPSLSDDNAWSLMLDCWSKPQERLSAEAVVTRIADVISPRIVRNLDPLVQHYLSHLQAAVVLQCQMHLSQDEEYQGWLKRSLQRCENYYKTGLSEAISWLLAGRSIDQSWLLSGRSLDQTVPPPHTALFYWDDSRTRVIAKTYDLKYRFEPTPPVVNDYRDMAFATSSPLFEVLVAPPQTLRWVPVPYRKFYLKVLGVRPVDCGEFPLHLDEECDGERMPWIARDHEHQTKLAAVVCKKYKGSIGSTLFEGKKYLASYPGFWMGYTRHVKYQFDLLCYAD